MTNKEPHSSTSFWRGPVPIVGIPLVVWSVLFTLGLYYKVDLEHAGLNSIFRSVLFFVPMTIMALLVLIGMYLDARDPDSEGETPVSRVGASKLAVSATLLLVVFPLVPVTILHVRGGQGLDFTAVILIGICAAAMQLVWPRLLVFNLDRDHAQEETLRTRVQSMAQAAGVRLEDVVVTTDDDEDGEEDDSLFAMVCGLAWSRRVVIGGRMASLLSPEELDAIVAHEFAHVTAHHIAKKITVIFALAMGLAALEWLPGAETFGGFLLFAATMALCVFIKLAFDRRFEVTADRLAADWAGPSHLRDAFAKLAAREPPSRLPPWLGTHPPMAQRIRTLERRIAG